MKKFARLTAVLIVLLAFSGLASAGARELGPFSTTGYTTNVMPISGYPYILPQQFEQFPSGYYKFRFLAQGGGVEDEATCVNVYGPVYGVSSCQELCGVTGKECGVAGELGGSFTFDEVGLSDFGGFGANSGDLTLNTDQGVANLKFSGTSSTVVTDNVPVSIVSGAFDSQKMKGDFKELKSPGIYNGNAGLVFTVDYDPCAKNEGLGINDQCDVNRCAVFGDDLKIEKDKVKWKIRNEGKQPITISSVLIHWPEKTMDKDGAEVLMPTLLKVKLGGKTLAEQVQPSENPSPPVGMPPWTSAWTRLTFSDDSAVKSKDREIDKNKQEELSLEFDKKGGVIPSNPWDYTILVEFEGEFVGECAVPFVAFEPLPAVSGN